MLIGIIGGQLQGLEAVYLARQAGFTTALIDKDPLVPARAFADEFFHMDVLSEKGHVRALLKKFDLILPATENYRTLCGLNEIASQCDIPLALDLAAYNISSSKIESNNLFARTGVAMPEPWPECGFPVIVKPSALSGSAGVVKVTDHAFFTKALESIGGDTVVQKYLAGPSYSLEVIAHKGACACLQVTELHFDEGYDCKRVLAGPAVAVDVESAFCELGERLAASLNLSGIMDIEVIDDGEELKVLEIDARLPSQTPSAVYHSSGVNIVELLSEYWLHNRLPSTRLHPGKNRRAVIYEHLHFHDGVLEVSGEHVIAGARGLKAYHDQFYADVIVANFEETPEEWVSTAIFTGENEAAVWERRRCALSLLQQTFRARKILDPEPFDVLEPFDVRSKN